MKRETGYYWVKTHTTSDWQIMYWYESKGKFIQGNYEFDNNLHVNETRILSPDEKQCTPYLKDCLRSLDQPYNE